MPVGTPPINPAEFLLYATRLFAVPEPDWQEVQKLYREAYERARAVLQPPITERLWSVCLN